MEQRPHAHSLAAAGEKVESWMTFAMFAQGYPMAQGAFCSEHLAPAILDDASHPGGTGAWTIRLSKTPCRTCAEQADIGSRGGSDGK